MPKIKKDIEQLRAKSDGFGRISWKQFEALLRDAGRLTAQQRIVKASFDKDEIVYITKAEAE